jgi:hypothetical protein
MEVSSCTGFSMEKQIFGNNIRIFYRVLTLSNAELNLICYLLALFGAHLILHVSKIWFNIGKKGSYSVVA